jgi:hypothetical protein
VGVDVLNDSTFDVVLLNTIFTKLNQYYFTLSYGTDLKVQTQPIVGLDNTEMFANCISWILFPLLLFLC